MKQVIIMALEPIEQRYTAQWINGIPKLLQEEAYVRTGEVEIHTLVGESIGGKVSEGAFLDFVGTNIWKSTQLTRLAEMIAHGEVRDGADIIWTDAWNTCIIQARYMFDLINPKLKVKMWGIWHAGSYDPNDFLGRIQDEWTLSTERALYGALDFNMFATRYHKDLFERTLGVQGRSLISGQPHNVLHEMLNNRPRVTKKRQVIFPHRNSVEKQPAIFWDLAREMPDVNFVFPLDHGAKPTKEEYYQLLEESAVMFSANLQETLGISAMEAVMLDTVPFLPNRLSYSEMYDSHFLYDSELTESLEKYVEHKEELKRLLYRVLDNLDSYAELLAQQQERLEEYLYPDAWIEEMFR